MVLAAPEFVEAQLVEMRDEIQVAAELQGWVLTHRMVWRKEGTKFHAHQRIVLLDAEWRRLPGRPE
jgi:hypothetical protein